MVGSHGFQFSAANGIFFNLFDPRAKRRAKNARLRKRYQKLKEEKKELKKEIKEAKEFYKL